MALFGCYFKVPGYVCAPDAFKNTMKRGSFIKAAAFAAILGQGQVYIVQEYASGTTEKSAKEKALKQLLSYGTFGKFFPEAFQGTGLKSLPLVKFAHHDKATAPYYTDAEIITNKGQQLQSNAVVATPAAQVPSINHFAALGLEAGASQEELKAAWTLACIRHHPDKGGDAQKFIQVTEAYRALERAEAVVTKTPPKALTYEASPEALKQQMHEANEVVWALEQQLAAAKKHRDQVTNTWAHKSDDVRAVARRDQAQQFVGEHFNCSARYWTTVEIRRWFRITSPVPNSDNTDPAFKAWEAEQKALGEDIRMGNEDPDPYVMFVAWHPGEYGNIRFRVKLGLDKFDAVDNGRLLDNVPCDVFAMVPKYREELLAMGFDTRVIVTQSHYSRWYKDFDQKAIDNLREAHASARERGHDERAAKRQRIHEEQQLEENPSSGLSPEEKAEVAEMLQQHRQGLLPLV